MQHNPHGKHDKISNRNEASLRGYKNHWVEKSTRSFSPAATNCQKFSNTFLDKQSPKLIQPLSVPCGSPFRGWTRLAQPLGVQCFQGQAYRTVSWGLDLAYSSMREVCSYALDLQQRLGEIKFSLSCLHGCFSEPALKHSPSEGNFWLFLALVSVKVLRIMILELEQTSHLVQHPHLTCGN